MTNKTFLRAENDAQLKNQAGYGGLIVDLLLHAEGTLRLRREAMKKATVILPAVFLDTFFDSASIPKKRLIEPFRDFIMPLTRGPGPELRGTVR